MRWMMVARPVRTKKRPSYHGQHYWLEETPTEARTERVILTYYPKGGKLQVSALFSDKETGAARRGKTVTLDQEDFELHPEARELVAKVLEEWR
jgi:hypothetical protein